MDTIEVIVYLVVALLLGTLILVFIRGWDSQETFQGIRGVFRPEAGQYEEIGAGQFSRTVLQVWESCGLGSTDMNRTIYVKDAVPLNKTLIFTSIKQANLCRTLQWNESGCGTRDDVQFVGTTGPAVLKLRCDAASRRLIITA